VLLCVVALQRASCLFREALPHELARGLRGAAGQ
jgi:hypothetical protein